MNGRASSAFLRSVSVMQLRHFSCSRGRREEEPPFSVDESLCPTTWVVLCRLLLTWLREQRNNTSMNQTHQWCRKKNSIHKIKMAQSYFRCKWHLNLSQSAYSFAIYDLRCCKETRDPFNFPFQLLLMPLLNVKIKHNLFSKPNQVVLSQHITYLFLVVFVHSYR